MSTAGLGVALKNGVGLADLPLKNSKIGISPISVGASAAFFEGGFDGRLTTENRRAEPDCRPECAGA
jgi:hypothetical protein